MKKGFSVALVTAVLATPLAAMAQAPDAAPAPPEQRRHAIRMMEAVLSRAVLTGAEHLAEQLGNGSPNMSFFTGQAKARGFMLDGYGVFFHVEIPEMQQSVVWSVTTVERDLAVARALDSLKRVVSTVPDGGPRVRGEEALKSLQLSIGPLPSVADVGGNAAALGDRGAMRAASVSGSEAVPDPPADPAVSILRDPNAAYRDAIKSALIDAMLEHSRGMNIRPDEWLSIAAHRGDSPLSPNEIVTSSTLVLRIKGSDLAIYDADRTRKDEIRARVEAREF